MGYARHHAAKAAFTIAITIVCAVYAAAAETGAKPATAPAKPAATNAPVAAPATKAPAGSRTTEAQLSGYTAEYVDQLYARISLQESRQERLWYVRGTYNRTTTDSGSSKSNVTTARLDCRNEYATDPGRYNVWSGVMSRRDRDKKTGTERSGYHYVSYGTGKQLDTRNKGDIGLGVLDIYDHDGGTRPALSFSVIGRRPMSSKLTMDGQVLAIQPLDRLRSTRVDSELGLSYALTQGLSVRLSWSANNLIKPVQGTKEWDSVIRLTLAFRRTSAL